MSEKNARGQVEDEFDRTIIVLAAATADWKEKSRIEGEARKHMMGLRAHAAAHHRAALVLAGTSPKVAALEDLHVDRHIDQCVEKVSKP